VEFQLVVLPEQDEEAGEFVPLVAQLWAELEELDDAEVDHFRGEELSAGSKGVVSIGGLLAGVPLDKVKAFINVLWQFASRTGRTVEASIDGDTIKITQASREQQDRVIEAWLARHTAGA
jgi:hypothetical protein